MVSSLPFLAPVFMKKAREYRSKHSGQGYGSSHRMSRSRGHKNGDHYQLSDVSNDKSVFASTNKSGSEENILQQGAIVKSVTYSVQVDEEADGQGTRRRNDSGSN